MAEVKRQIGAQNAIIHTIETNADALQAENTKQLAALNKTAARTESEVSKVTVSHTKLTERIHEKGQKQEEITALSIKQMR